MANVAEQYVFVLDDEPGVREIVARVLRGAGVRICCFDNPAACLARLRSQTCSLLITDLKMPDMDGIEVLIRVKRLAPWVPVLVISGYGDIPTAVKAMKAGAVDFIEKPFKKKDLTDKVKSILQQSASTDTSLDKPLTQTETSVLMLVLDGKSSKDIARVLHRSTRTIEWHRSHVMRKLKAENMLDLVKRVVAMGLIDMAAKTELAKVNDMLGGYSARCGNCVMRNKPLPSGKAYGFEGGVY